MLHEILIEMIQYKEIFTIMKQQNRKSLVYGNRGRKKEENLGLIWENDVIWNSYIKYLQRSHVRITKDEY